jgi:hypothetical protein
MYRFLFFIASLFLTPAAWAQPVTFGASVQLTEPVANTGRYYKDAYELAVEKINDAGGIKIGSAHRKIALKILDNQSDVNLSVRQYVQLLAQDKVNFLLGPFASNFVLADSSIAEKSRVLVYEIDCYRYWQRELGRDDFSFGQFGENFTVEGLPDDEVSISESRQVNVSQAGFFNEPGSEALLN